MHPPFVLPKSEIWLRGGGEIFFIPNPFLMFDWGYPENLVCFCSVEAEILNFLRGRDGDGDGHGDGDTL